MAIKGKRYSQLPVTEVGNEAALAAANRLVAATYDGDAGRLAYDAFDFINAAYFGDRLPCPRIVWALTPHAHCLGMASAGERATIVLHPSLLGGSEREDPWRIPPAWLGWRRAFDTLVHECIHVYIDAVLGDRGNGTSSHECEAWVAEVNRLAPLLGLPGVRAARSVVKRVPVDGPLTKRGTPPTKVQRVCAGTVPFADVARFPYGVRAALGLADAYYRRDGYPWEEDREDPRRYRQLAVTDEAAG